LSAPHLLRGITHDLELQVLLRLRHVIPELVGTLLGLLSFLVVLVVLVVRVVIVIHLVLVVIVIDDHLVVVELA
tara:strand:- start:193 stop:414 length:222 start_codon:yes stop_codon:yes gene_type:complete